MSNKRSGIYKVTCLVTNEIYIGQSVGIDNRWRSHRLNFTDYKRVPTIFTMAIRRYGLENFKFEIVERAPKDLTPEKLTEWLYEKERHYIAAYDSFVNGLNMTLGEGYTLSDSLIETLQSRTLTELEKRRLKALLAWRGDFGLGKLAQTVMEEKDEE